MLIIVLVVFSLNISVLSIYVFPQSPCPNIFSYERNEENVAFGVVRFQNDYSGYYKVEVNMTLAAFTNTNIAIKRSSPTEAVQNGEDIVYHVMFPASNVLPEVTSIVFNEKLYCSTNRKAPMVGGVTTLNGVHYFSTPIISKGSLHKPYVQSYPEPVQVSDPPHTSISSITYPDSIQSTQPININQLLNLLSSSSTPQTSSSTSITKIVSMYMGTTSKQPYVSSSEPVKVTEKLPITSSISDITNRFLDELKCGLTQDTQELLVHGDPTTEDQHPWLIAMFHLQESTAEYKFKCAANLVSNKHVITAAHCVRTRRSEAIPKDNVILVLGKHNIRSWAVRSEIRNVEQIHVHPQYKQPSDADIAVITMSKIVEFTAVIQPICLWSEDNSLEKLVGSNGTVIGWGKDEFDNAYVAEPKELKMPIASQEDCLRSDERYFKITSNRTFCAGSRKGEGVCTGDSGGGFIIQRNRRWTLRGIVSSALVDPVTRSCDVNNYMVFSDVAKFIPWISRIMEK